MILLTIDQAGDVFSSGSRCSNQCYGNGQSTFCPDLVLKVMSVYLGACLIHEMAK